PRRPGGSAKLRSRPDKHRTTNVDQNFTQVLDGATGEFKDVYSQSASQLRQVLIDNKAMSKGIVVDSAINQRPRPRSKFCCSSTSRSAIPSILNRASIAAESRSRWN
ncbi:MAG: Mce-associated rane protein, partial [Mycobacterium sp.]|nr:Mce-associated rane protein [Mycobacterium sp.]